MDTTETLPLTDAGCDQGGDEMVFLSRSKVLPLLVQTGDGNATTCGDKDEQPERNLGYYCRRSVIFCLNFFKGSDEGAKSNIFQTFESSF